MLRLGVRLDGFYRGELSPRLLQTAIRALPPDGYLWSAVAADEEQRKAEARTAALEAQARRVRLRLMDNERGDGG